MDHSALNTRKKGHRGKDNENGDFSIQELASWIVFIFQVGLIPLPGWKRLAWLTC